MSNRNRNLRKKVVVDDDGEDSAPVVPPLQSKAKPKDIKKVKSIKHPYPTSWQALLMCLHVQLL